MKKKLLLLLFSLASLGLVSCGGGNDGASTGTPVVAQATIWTPQSNGGCGNSLSVNSYANPAGPNLTIAQVNACVTAAFAAQTLAQCNALGGSFSPQVIYGGCTVQNGSDYYNPVPPPPTY
jgi:ABC-type glycerol-3-phosphate transport system substrate-binding protein